MPTIAATRTRWPCIRRAIRRSRRSSYFQQLSVEVRGQGGRQGRRQLQPLRRRHAGHRRPAGQGADDHDFEDYVAICKQIELQVLRDLPLIGLSTLSFTVARRANVDLGYQVKSGYARWRFHRATKTAPDRDRRAMTRYLLLRLPGCGTDGLLVLTLVFIAMRILPGDPAIAALGDKALPEQLAEFREKMGLERPALAAVSRLPGRRADPRFRRARCMNSRAGGRAHRQQPALHDRADARRDGDGGDRRHAARRARGDAPQQAAGFRRARLLADRLRDPRLLSRRAAADHLLAQPRLVPDQRRRRGLLRPHAPHLPAGADAGLRQGRLHRPADAHLAARGAGQGLCPHGPRQGRARARA